MVHRPLPRRPGHLLDLLPAALFLHVFLAYPTGRLQSRAERVLVVTCDAVCLGLQVLKVAVGIDLDYPLALLTQPGPRPARRAGPAEPGGRVAAARRGRPRTRARRTSRPSRRGVALTVDSFGMSLVMLALLYVAGLRSWAAFETIRNLTFAVLGLAPIAFLLGLLDARLARADVGDLVVHLRGTSRRPPGAPGARLHDPTLSVAYWLPQYGAWADQAGGQVSLPTEDDDRAVRLIAMTGTRRCARLPPDVEHDERELLDSVVAAAAIALENARRSPNCGPNSSNCRNPAAGCSSRPGRAPEARTEPADGGRSASSR